MVSIRDKKSDQDTVEQIDNASQDNSPDKAPVARTIDNMRVLGLTDEDAEFYASYTPEQRKRVIRKVDKRLVPMLAILYLISHLDRANIGNAKIEGLAKDLKLSGIQWNIVLSLFFVPYVLLEVPSNILLKKFTRPSVYLGTLVTAWGVIMTLHGVVRNFGGLLAARLLLGAFESGFYPGAVYLCTFWYMPRDLAQRIAWFYCTSSLPALGGKWLEPDEIRFLELQRFIKQGGRFQDEGGESRLVWHDLKAVLTNWRLYMQAYILMCQSATSYGTKFTLPTITKSMGFSTTNAQLMTIPPYVAGALSALFFSRLSDRFYWRMPFVAIPMLLITAGYAVVLSLDGDLGGPNVGAAFTGIILTTIGIYPIAPAGSSWAANNLAPASRRAIGVAFNIGVGNLGGIVGSYIYLDTEAPRYPTGFGLSLAFGCSGLLVALLLELSYKWGNKRKEAWTEADAHARYSEDELIKLGDKSPLFRYTL
ncbi:hypothetical protein RB597_010216 [Gaeumannomyces tritici]